MSDLYKCDECGHECRTEDMGADACFNGVDEDWSNWICPICQQWPQSLEDGWTKVKP